MTGCTAIRTPSRPCRSPPPAPTTPSPWPTGGRPPTTRSATPWPASTPSSRASTSRASSPPPCTAPRSPPRSTRAATCACCPGRTCSAPRTASTCPAPSVTPTGATASPRTPRSCSPTSRRARPPTSWACSPPPLAADVSPRHRVPLAPRAGPASGVLVVDRLDAFHLAGEAVEDGAPLPRLFALEPLAHIQGETHRRRAAVLEEDLQARLIRVGAAKGRAALQPAPGRVAQRRALLEPHRLVLTHPTGGEPHERHRSQQSPRSPWHTARLWSSRVRDARLPPRPPVKMSYKGLSTGLTGARARTGLPSGNIQTMYPVWTSPSFRPLAGSFLSSP